MMKLATFILIVSLVQVSAATLGQNVTLKRQNITLETVLREIQKQTGYDVLIGTHKFQTSKRINVDFNNTPIVIVMDKVVRLSELVYEIEDRTIIIKEKEPSFLDRVASVFTVHDVHGRVVDTEERPLSGATIKVKATGKAVSTDGNGNFYLKDVEEGTILVISYTGYVSKEVSAEKEMGDITLEVSLSKLDETVVIGYGTTTRRLNTGSVVSVKAEDIARQPVANPLNALQGRMAGVMISNTGGLPGSNMKVQIRGINSIILNPGNDGGNPLYIVDGVPFSSIPMNFYRPTLAGANDYLSPLNSINPGDIESVEVLKDADATAIYGSRGANGIILITTKKGKSGKAKFDVNVYTGKEKATNFIERLNTEQFLALRKEAFANDNVIPTALNAPELLVYDQNQYTDFQKLFIGNTPDVTSTQINLSGGNENIRFTLGGNFRKEGTIYPGNLSYKRGGGHLNVEHNSLNKKLYASGTVNYTTDKNNNISQSIIGITLVPNYPIYDSAGNLTWSGGPVNPIALTRQSSFSQTNSLITSAIIKYDVIPGLKIQTNLGYNYNTFNTILTYPLSALNPAGVNPINRATYGTNNTSSYIVEPQINYIKEIGDGKLEIMMGGTWQYSTANGWSIRGQNYSSDELLKDLTSAGTVSNPGSINSEYKYLSVFSRVNYNWKSRYIFSGTFRRDGSSRFGPARQFGNFGSGAAAWLFSNENFVTQELPSLSYGKLRGSYGIVGNDKIADYGFMSTYSSTTNYQNVAGMIPARIANPDYSWEVTRKLEAALELGFLKDRILLTAAWFKNRSSNQLVGYPLPSQAGFTSYQYNLPAILQNTGTEFTLNTANIKSKDFTWNTSFNISFIDNKLVSFPGLGSTSYARTMEEGQSVSIQKGFHFVGVDTQTGIPKFSTADGIDSNIPSTSKDEVVIGKTIPDFYGGLSNTLGYRGFQLDFLFQFVRQEGFTPTYWPGATRSAPVEALNHWEKPGDISNNPIPSTTSTNNDAGKSSSAYASSDRFWGDASFIRLKNLELSYNLPQRWTEKIKLNSCRIFLQGQNLWTITKYKGSDPEIPNQGYIVPTLRIVSAGLQVSF